jgi:hypothetical protein
VVDDGSHVPGGIVGYLVELSCAGLAMLDHLDRVPKPAT